MRLRYCTSTCPLLQALQADRLGPDKSPYSPARQKRLAVQEAATALVCTLLPAIEPVVHVTIKPREKHPLGQTVLRVNDQRELTKQFTRQYLEEQLLTTLAGMQCCRSCIGRHYSCFNYVDAKCHRLHVCVIAVKYGPVSMFSLPLLCMQLRLCIEGNSTL